MLLAGVLLVIAFILYSIQVALLANLGQQTGREVETPLLDDYALIRRGLQIQLEDEMRNPLAPQANPPPCPSDRDEFGLRVISKLDHLARLESARGQSFEGTLLSIGRAPPAPDPQTRTTISLQLNLANGPTRVSDKIDFSLPCAP